MFIRVQYQKWDPGIALFHLAWSSSLIVGLRKQTNLQLFEFIFVEKCSCFICGVHIKRWIKFSHAWFSWHLILDISPSMYQDHMGHWDHFWSHWFQFWGKQETLEIYSPLEKMIVIRAVHQQEWWFLYPLKDW